LYVSGVAADGRPLLLRSGDAGESFEASELPATSSVRRPFIAAVGPEDDRVFVRLDGLPGTLLASDDGGQNFARVLELRVPVQGFALSPDGSSVLVTNTFDGSYRADLDTLEFERVACRGPSCLLWTSQGLFGCGTNLPDGFIVGASSDRGVSFERVLELSCVRGPLACDANSSIGSTCQNEWPAIRSQLGAETCSPPARPTPVDCGLAPSAEGGAAGEGSHGAAGGSGPAAGAAAGDGGSSTRGPPAASERSGCSCEVSGGQRSGRGFRAALVLTLTALVGRRNWLRPRPTTAAA
jgi:hypothetical protein